MLAVLGTLFDETRNAWPIYPYHSSLTIDLLRRYWNLYPGAMSDTGIFKARTIDRVHN